MTNTIFYLLITTLFLNFSLGSIQYFGVNRTFMLMFKGVFENSLVSIDEYGNPIEPYFDQNKLIDLSEQYFEMNLQRYVTNYVTSYIFYESGSENYCVNRYCNGVKISLKAQINNLFNYEKARIFYIQENY